MHLAVGGQQDALRGQASLTDRAGAALGTARHEQGAAAAVRVLERALLVVGEVIIGDIAGAASEAKQASSAVPPRGEEGAADTEERLVEGEKEEREKGISTEKEEEDGGDRDDETEEGRST